MEPVKEFLVSILSDLCVENRGVNVKTIFEIGQNKGFSKRILKTARKELGIVSREYEDGWFWRLSI